MLPKINKWCIVTIGFVGVILLTLIGCQRYEGIEETRDNVTVNNPSQPQLDFNPNGAQETLFYYKKYVPEYNTYELLEVCTTQLPSPPPGFSTTTVAEMHSLGYKTPSENFEEAYLMGHYDEHVDRGFSWFSFINLYYVGSAKFAVCGSKTCRNWYQPGNLGLLCGAFRTGHSGPLCSFGPFNVWGWRTTHTFTIVYPQTLTFGWAQIGDHWWNNPQSVSHSGYPAIPGTYIYF